MQFFLSNLTEDIIHINIFDNEFFSPNGLLKTFIKTKETFFFIIIENIGYTSIHLVDILPCPLETFLSQSSHTFTQTIYLNNGASVAMRCLVELLPPYQ
jgi:hypothetical protein